MFGIFGDKIKVDGQDFLQDQWKIVTPVEYARHKREAGFMILMHSDGTITLDMEKSLTSQQQENLKQVAFDIFNHNFP